MATQLKHTDFSLQTAPGPNIRVVFSAGPAAIAMRDKLATVPEADQTLDELTTIDMTGVSVGMAALLAASDEAEAAYNDYYKTVYEPVDVRYFAALGTEAEATIKIERDAINDHFDQLVTICSDAQSRVVCHPVTTVADHRIKLAFIAKHQMGDGMDWTKQLLADAERIAVIHADANNIVVPFVSSRYPADIAPPLTFDAAAPMRELLDQRNAVAAWMNRDSVSTDAEVEPFCDTLNGIERTITSRFAMTTDDAIAKLIAVVQVAAEGSEVREEEACRALIDARRVFGLGYIHDFMLAHMGDAPPAVAALPSAEVGLNAAWAEATAGWQAVRQEMSVEQLSDDQLDALVEREMQAFCKLADLPLRDHHDVMTRLRAMLDVFPNVPPDPVNKLIDEMARMSAIPPRGDDRILLDAFADRRRQFVENHAVILAADAEDAYFARLDRNDETLLKGSAVSIPGVLAKLRVAFTQLEPNAWSDQAIGDPAGMQFREGLHMSDMYVRMLWSATEDLARISGVNLSEQAK